MQGCTDVSDTILRIPKVPDSKLKNYVAKEEGEERQDYSGAYYKALVVALWWVKVRIDAPL
jgi:hypothetical protein